VKADETYQSPQLPVTVQHLRDEGQAFITYMSGWKVRRKGAETRSEFALPLVILSLLLGTAGGYRVGVLKFIQKDRGSIYRARGSCPPPNEGTGVSLL